MAYVKAVNVENDGDMACFVIRSTAGCLYERYVYVCIGVWTSRFLLLIEKQI